MEWQLNRLRQTRGSTTAYFKHWTPPKVIQSFSFNISDIYGRWQKKTSRFDDLFNSGGISESLKSSVEVGGENF